MQHLPEGQKPQVEASWQGAEYHLSAEVRNVPAAQWRVTFGEDNISRRYCFFFSDYRYRGYREAEHQPDAMRTAGDEMAQAMAAAMFTMQEKVTMPGRIIHSNATHVERGTGTWDIALNQVGSGYELSARSRRMNLPEIVAAVLFLLAGIALVLHRSGLPSIQHWSQAPDEARAVQQPPGCEEGAAPPAEAEGPSDDAERAVARAKRLLHQGMTGDALQLLQAHLEDHPYDRREWALLGALHFERGDWPAAEEAARRVLQLAPDSARDWCNLGVVLRKQGRLQEAAGAQQEALRLDPSYGRAQTELRKLQEPGEDPLSGQDGTE